MLEVAHVSLIYSDCYKLWLLVQWFLTRVTYVKCQISYSSYRKICKKCCWYLYKFVNFLLDSNKIRKKNWKKAWSCKCKGFYCIIEFKFKLLIVLWGFFANMKTNWKNSINFYCGKKHHSWIFWVALRMYDRHAFQMRYSRAFNTIYWRNYKKVIFVNSRFPRRYQIDVKNHCSCTHRSSRFSIVHTCNSKPIVLLDIFMSQAFNVCQKVDFRSKK